MKHFLLKTWLILVCLLTGAGTMWADADYTLTPSAGSNNSYAGNCDVTVGDITWNVTGNAQQVPWRLGGKSITNVDRAVYSKTAYANAVKKVDLTVGAASSITVNSLKLVYSTNADFSNSLEISKSFNANSTISFEGEFPAKAYYKFVFNLTVSSTSNKFVEFNKVEFYNTNGGTTPEPTKYTVSIANDIANGTVTASPTSAAEGATITLTATPATGYEFGSWNVTNASTNADITVTDNKFTMPAANVNVSATFNKKPARPENEIFYESFDTNDGTGGNDDKWSGSIATNNISQDNDGWTYVKGNGANACAKFGAGSSLGSATTPALGQACDATLTFMAAAWNGSSESTTLKLSVIGGGTISPETVTMTKGEWNTFTATLTGLTADSKVKFEGNSSSNSRFFLDEVSVVKTGEATTVKTVTSIAVKAAPTKIAYTTGDKFSPAGLVITATYNMGEPEDVAYEGNESKFSFEPSLSTALTTENTSVTIIYEGKTATQAITVEDYSIANTQETAYTVAEAIALIDADKGLTIPVYVKGTVSAVVTAFNEVYGNITVNISEDGETNGNQFQLYRNFKGADKEKWTSATEAPEVGDQIVAYGTLTKYNSTYEMAEGNYVVSIVKKNPIALYTITVKDGIENGTVSVSANEAKAGDEITITATADEGYEVDEYIVTSTENSEDEVTVADGKFTMPAYNVTVNVTFKEKEGGEEGDDTPTCGEAKTFNFGTFTSDNDVTINAGDYTITLHKNTGSTKPTWNANSNEARVYAVGSVDIASSKNIVKIVYDYNVNANSKGNAPTVDGAIGTTNKGTWTEETKTWTGKDTMVTLTTSGAAGNLGFKSITVYFEQEIHGTLNFVATDEDGYWATFSCSEDVIFDANDVIVYTAAIDNNELVTIDVDNNSLSCVTDKTKDGGWVAGYYVQAGAAVLINSVDDSVNYYYIDEDDYTPNQLTNVETDSEYNMLRPASAAMEGNYLFYKLAYGDWTNKTDLGFYWGDAEGAAFTCKAGTAYLAVPTTTASNLRGFVLGGDTLTGIKDAAINGQNTEIFNLQGQRISRLQQGVNIVNGKKVIR